MVVFVLICPLLHFKKTPGRLEVSLALNYKKWTIPSPPKSIWLMSHGLIFNKPMSHVQQ